MKTRSRTVHLKGRPRLMVRERASTDEVKPGELATVAGSLFLRTAAGVLLAVQASEPE